MLAKAEDIVVVYEYYEDWVFDPHLTFIIVLAVVGALVLLSLLIFVIWLVCRRKRE
jgi:hypothetical protein